MILIVEDDADIADLVAETCRAAGHQAETAPDGVAAVAAAGARYYTLIFMDLHVPKLGGIAAALKIRDLPAPFGTVPMLMLTGGLDARDIDKMKQGTFNGGIQKPFTRTDLAAAIEKFARPG